MLKKHFLYTISLFLCLFLFTSCDEEETDSGTGSEGSGSSMYSDSDFSGTTWEQIAADMSGHIVTNEDVDVLDSWNEASGGITVTIISADSSETTTETPTELTYMNVEEWNNDYYYYYYDDGSYIEFEFSTISDWDNDDNWSDYAELEIHCALDSCTDTTCTDCNANFEGHFDSDDEYTDNIWMNDMDISFTWDPSTFTFTFTDNFSYTDEWGGITISIMSGNTISAETREFTSGTYNLVVEDSETPDSYQNSYISFNADGTITDDYSIDCSQVPADEEWDCYDEGCGVIYDDLNGNGNLDWDELVTGCESIDCSNFNNSYDCWDQGPCWWNSDEDSCESEDDDDGPGGMTWEIVDDQMVISVGEDYYYDYDIDMMPVQIFDITYDGDNLLLTQSIEMCDYYMGFYASMLYYLYEYYFGIPWGTGSLADYYEGYLDEICVNIYDELSEDIYGLSGEQVESAIQTQTITLEPSDWSPSMRSNSRAQRMHNPLVKPKLLKKLNHR